MNTLRLKNGQIRIVGSNATATVDVILPDGFKGDLFDINGNVVGWASIGSSDTANGFDKCPTCKQILGCGCGNSTKRMLRSQLPDNEQWRQQAELMKTNDCRECIAWTAKDWRTLQDLLRGDEEDCGCGDPPTLAGNST